MKIAMRAFTTLIILFCVQILIAQNTPSDTSYWTKGSLYTITFSQVSLTNWAAGGKSSSSVNGFFNTFADYREGRQKWQNLLDLGYGFLKQSNEDFQKSDDKMNLVSKYGYQMSDASKKWFFTALVDFKSQFSEGYSIENQDSVISRFMAPGYLTIGAGIEFAPSDFISLSYQPVTGKMTFVTDKNIIGESGAYGVDPGESYRAELGSYFRFSYKKEALKNVNVDMRLELFSGYRNKSFGNIDINWQNTIVLKINKYLSTNLFTQLLYDDDIKIGIDHDNDGVIDISKQRIQFKSVFGIGLIYQAGKNRSE